MTTPDAAAAIETARELRVLSQRRDEVLQALDVLADAAPDARAALAFDLAMRHGTIRAVGLALDWPPDARRRWIDSLLDDPGQRAFAHELFARCALPTVRVALAGAMPGSFPLPDAAVWTAYRAHLTGRLDRPIWDDPEGVALRPLWVTPRCERVRYVEREPRLAGFGVARELAPEAPVDDVITALVDEVLAAREPRVTLVVGPAGLGKTALCEVLADRLARRDDLSPVHLRLRDVDGDRPLLDELHRVLRAEGFAFEVGVTSAPRPVLVLDGFDELGDARRGTLSVFMSQLQRLLREGRVHAAVLTGRDALLRDRDAALPDDAVVFALRPFDDARIQRWCAQWELATGRAFDATQLAQDSSAEDSLRGVASLPLMLYMLARMAAEGRTVHAQSFEAGAEAYRTILDWCCERHQRERPHDRWNRVTLRRFLRAAGYASVVHGRDVLLLDDLQHALRALGLEVGDDAARLSAEHTVLAFGRRGPTEATWEFTHRSFAEFLAAEWMASRVFALLERTSNRLDPEERWRLDAPEATREWMNVFGTVQLPARVERYLLWMLREDAAALPGLRARLADVYRALIDETEAEEAIRVARAWRLRPFQVRGFALANLFMLGGAAQRFRPEEVHPDHFLDAVHAIRAVASAETIGRVYGCVGLQGIRNAYVRDAKEHWRGVVLPAIDLSGCDLSGVDFTWVVLIDADMRDVKLTNAVLRFASILRVNLRGADLRGSDLVCAALVDVDLRGADLSNADLGAARLARVSGQRTQFPPDIEKIAIPFQLRDAAPDDAPPADSQDKPA